METHSNNLIKQKIDSVDSLPEGYLPNLNSKWEILEAGLTPKKKPILLYFNKISAIAAVLLLIGGVSMFFIKSIKRNEVIKPVVSIVKPTEKETPSTQIIVSNSKAAANSPQLVTNSYQQLNKDKTEKQMVIVPSEPIKKDSFILIEKPAIILAEATPKKAKRFTEIDFNEPMAQEKTIPTNMAFNQRFSFKIGTLTQNNGGNLTKNESTNFGLTQKIN